MKFNKQKMLSGALAVGISLSCLTAPAYATLNIKDLVNQAAGREPQQEAPVEEQPVEVTQEELDQLIGGAEKAQRALPKGINMATLKRIQQHIEQAGSTELSLTQMQEDLRISTVTLRVYLDYLVQICVSYFQARLI